MPSKGQRPFIGGYSMEPKRPAEEPISGDLILGAERIAEFLFGDPGRRRDVYRNPAQFPFFKWGTHIAARKSTLLAEIAKREAAALEKFTPLKAK